MTNKETKLDRILNEMGALSQMDDREVAHSEADDLLCEAIKIMDSDTVYSGQLVDAFNNISKWYA